MTVKEKIKIISNKSEQNKVQYDLDKLTAEISAISSENVSKYEFLTSEVLPEKGLFEKAATIKRFEYSPLSSELKKWHCKKIISYQGLNKVHECDRTINKDDKKRDLKKHNKLDLTYDSNHSFYRYHDFRKIDNLSFI